METNEATRVMGTVPGGPGAPAIDRTMVAGTAMPPAAGATQMGVTVTCPICRTNNSGMEAYCGECGFLLSSAPGAEEAAPDQTSGPAMELVENTSGRRFRLKSGPNLVGRENCDILLMDGTVSRRHAQVTLDGATVSVTDLGSTNGTEVDGSKLSPNQPVTLNPGGTVRFGNAALTFATSEPAAAHAPAEATIVAGMPSPAAEQVTEAAVDEASEAPETTVPTGAVEEAAPVAVEAAASAGVAVLRPTGPGETITVKNGTFTIGRRAGNDIVIATDPYISGAHAMLQCDEVGCFLTDVGSTNGTTVNGTRLAPNTRQMLMDGDEVMFGQSSYKFEALPPAGAEEPAPPAEAPAPEPDDLAATEETGAAPDQVVI